MISLKEIRKKLLAIESDRVEKTISTTNTDKFGQAICAFSNDLPNHCQPGYLLLGVNDDGSIKGLDATDELLKNIAAIRTDGNIQPQPSMVVEKFRMPEGDIIVVEVQPATFPPVRYKGRIWIRIGPRKGVANETDERILYEKRASHIRTFDAMPCLGATIEDIDLTVFKQQYLPKAMPEDVLLEEIRPITVLLQSFGFFDLQYNCPTYAGILFFGKQVERFLSGAYLQYVRFKGKDRGGDIVNEYKFSGNLCKPLYQLDTFVDTTIANTRPVPISALQEKIIIDYPHWATRELLMNAICHRDYEGNGPVQFYQYDDRIEIMNPGGLYGKVTPQNFPNVNDYRNPVVAEALKVLGFVNRFSRGVLKVKTELKENGNGEPTFSLDLITAFLAEVFLSANAKPYPEHNKKDNEGINEGKEALNEGINEGKEALNEGINEKEILSYAHLPLPQRNIMKVLKVNPKLTYTELADNIGVSESTIWRMVRELKADGYLKRERGNKHGNWIILK